MKTLNLEALKAKGALLEDNDLTKIQGGAMSGCHSTGPVSIDVIAGDDIVPLGKVSQNSSEPLSFSTRL